jgi:hypothetical protein
MYLDAMYFFPVSLCRHESACCQMPNKVCHHLPKSPFPYLWIPTTVLQCLYCCRIHQLGSLVPALCRSIVYTYIQTSTPKRRQEKLATRPTPPQPNLRSTCSTPPRLSQPTSQQHSHKQTSTRHAHPALRKAQRSISFDRDQQARGTNNSIAQKARKEITVRKGYLDRVGRQGRQVEKEEKSPLDGKEKNQITQGLSRTSRYRSRTRSLGNPRKKMAWR